MSGLVLVHGGAGPMRHMEGDRERAYREGLERAARAGREALLARGDALAAVVAAVKYMEADGPFNAGIGACLDVGGRYALDAALMRGRDRAAGAVGACTATLHPTEVCLDLLREGRHVLLVGEGADRRATALGLPALPPIPARKLETYRKLLGEAEATERPLEQLATVGRPDDEEREAAPEEGDRGHDTVGAVALDAAGRVAAAVSTGGLWLKAPGRVGDSALVGAGLFACDELGAAASATGIGERMIRAVSCFLACHEARRHGAASAAERAVADLGRRFGDDSGGVIVVDQAGGVGAAFNTQGMGRALARVGEDAVRVALWADERL